MPRRKTTTLTLDVTRRSYATSKMDDDAFDALTTYDDAYEGDWKNRVTLSQKLDKLGCCDIEFNGHFGAHVYFALGVNDDTDDNRAEILRTIEAHVTLAKRWQARRKKAAR